MKIAKKAGINSTTIAFLAFLIMIIACANAVSAEDVAIKTYVNDYANTFTPEESAQITEIAQRIYDSGQAQYAVVTINSLGGEDIATYAYDLANGHLGDTEKDNGLLLLIAKEDRQYRFEVGYGLEGPLNDAKVGRIGRNYLVPNFRNEEYGKGVIEASQIIEQILINGTEPAIIAQEEEGLDTFEIVIIVIVVLIYIIFIVLAYIQRRREEKKNSKYMNAAKGASGIFWGGFGGGFGGSGGSSGGGFGGFGGGGFGGGGAGGGW